MDILKRKIKKYQKVLTDYIEGLANDYNNALGNEFTYQAIIDLRNNHFQLVRIG